MRHPQTSSMMPRDFERTCAMRSETPEDSERTSVGVAQSGWLSRGGI
jgi:hypothetical protein